MRGTSLLAAVPFVLAVRLVAASDLDPLGFYIGGAAGRAEVRSSITTQPSYEFDEHDAGWKVLVGVRPIRLFAAEIEYVDFGHPTATTAAAQLAPFTLYSDVLQRAPTLSGLLYAPIPLPYLDVYARAGLARLQSSGNPFLNCTSGPCPQFAPYPSFPFDRTATDFLYGAGLQVKYSALALRLEYERINDSRGDPDMLSAGVTWSF